MYFSDDHPPILIVSVYFLRGGPKFFLQQAAGAHEGLFHVMFLICDSYARRILCAAIWGDCFLIRSKNNAVHFFCHTGNGTREWSGKRCVFATPREFPLHSRSLTISWWGGGGQITQITIFATKMAFSYLGWGSQSDMCFQIVKYIYTVSRRTPLFLEVTTQRKVPKILADTIYDTPRHPTNNSANSCKFPFPFRFLKVLIRGNRSFLYSHFLLI